jgi:hypothetical protein
LPLGFSKTDRLTDWSVLSVQTAFGIFSDRPTGRLVCLVCLVCRDWFVWSVWSAEITFWDFQRQTDWRTGLHGLHSLPLGFSETDRLTDWSAWSVQSAFGIFTDRPTGRLVCLVCLVCRDWSVWSVWSAEIAFRIFRDRPTDRLVCIVCRDCLWDFHRQTDRQTGLHGLYSLPLGFSQTDRLTDWSAWSVWSAEIGLSGLSGLQRLPLGFSETDRLADWSVLSVETAFGISTDRPTDRLVCLVCLVCRDWSVWSAWSAEIAFRIFRNKPTDRLVCIVCRDCHWDFHRQTD